MVWLGLIIGLLLIALGLLAVPIKIRATWNPEVQLLAIRYLGFGYTTDFAARLRIIDWLGWRFYRSKIKAVREKKPKPPPKKPKKKTPLRGVLQTLYDHRRTVRATLRRSLHYLIRLMASPRLSLARLDITAGSGNPALTGMYYGWFRSVQPIWNSNRITVNWQPVFDQWRFSASFDGRLQLRPWQPVRHTIRLIYELPKFALYRLYKDFKAKEE